MDAALVTVRGRAVAPAQPDRARLGLEIAALRPRPQEALGDVARRSDEAVAILGDLNIPREAWSTTGVSVHEEREYDSDSRRYFHRGYSATNQLSMRIEEQDLLGRLIKEMTERAGARISGPSWEIALDNPARQEAYRQAAIDARRKAEAFADALGVRLGAILEVSEPGLSRNWDSSVRSDRFLAVESAASMSEPEMEVHAGDLEVRAAVEATFLLEQS